ncbi:MAG: glutamine--tRNA ligase/YqeY domain fusion protein [Anaerovibrio sp.]|uniref:glutamine--tRNA ligase/YqeY domain fusion protein n=1 Tax=Anaerovibrio lipolyticus TaxID=82374 RepID=UPI001F2B375C|nr:glutamine--tRNA ligase/YqeY domain fusion protein [Anaerovibrio lipolyticus]MCF2601830.1 glutamine--tRNA ligase/YqeY domain fusion protein [Anaerovibrio lipolyticus]MDD6849210.1 glutamine--tRNA ligase/YqeY domain fusion protein [Veillonellaceae bacterium]MDD7656528.1 glutamine--tRNA ligase/YqeY domain fusion protein [Veillonellaceae bacterium]MDY5330340.1 glutamine--tRNA ligase/YqeY domain fusion protein [Anaerovibrio sp.]
MPEILQNPSNFIQNEINDDLKNGRYSEGIHTRFPPEPNGYLHIGHAKSICLNFGLAQQYGGMCNLRFDDTNPVKEDVEYVDSIQADVKWLGFSWDKRMYYASDYFEKLYEFAVQLIKNGKAYVDDSNAEEIRAMRGTLTEAGKESPYRNRSVEENLALFEAMKQGEFADGEKVLRAKIDMASPNINMRDPVIYRIAHATHHRTGDAWCIYPMYDFAHPLSDAIEGITHSICTLEFEDHRPLYDWCLESLGFDVNTRPRQIEFARLNLTNTVTSKRKLRQLVEEGYVAGWDDPRMPTISGLRRRGYTPAALRNFCSEVGVAKANSLVDVAMLEHCIRDDLNNNADRIMAVLHPLKVVITNYPEGKKEYMLAENHPIKGGHRYMPFSRELYIEQEDFMEDAPKKFFRLKPEGEVRLKHGYIIKCEEVIKDAEGKVVELHCTYDPDSKTGGATANRKVKGTIHWVSAADALEAEVRLYDYLIETDEKGEVPADFLNAVNKNSLEVLQHVMVEPSAALTAEGTHYQFLRQGYYVVDKDSTPDHLVFNRVVGLKDSWAKVKKG